MHIDELFGSDRTHKRLMTGHCICYILCARTVLVQ